MSKQNQFNTMSSRRFSSFMKLGSKEEQKLKLLIMGNDVNRTMTYLECMNPKDIQHLFDSSIHKLDNAGRGLFIETLKKDPKLLSVLIAKLRLKKDYISSEEALGFLMSTDILTKEVKSKNV